MTSATSPGIPASASSSLSPSTHVKMTADIATSYLGHNPIAPERVKDVIMSIHDALREVHSHAASFATGDGVRELVSSTIASTASIPQAEAALPAQLPAQAPMAEVAKEPAPQAETAPVAAAARAAAPEAAVKSPAKGGRKARGIPAVSVPEPLADGGRVRRQPRLKAVAGTDTKAPETAPVETAPVEVVAEAASVAEAPAAAAVSKVPEIAWATTELGLQPTYAPRSAKEIARIRKAVFVPEYDGKKGGFVRCLEDGQVRRMLKKHLKFLEIPPAEYLAKWGLPAEFPLVHPEFSESRANQIKSAGLWEQRKSVKAKKGEEVDFDAPNVKELQRREREARRTAKAA